MDEDHEFYLALDNALLLLYSAGWNGSEQDRPHLLARQPFGQKLMQLTVTGEHKGAVFISFSP